MLELVPVNSMYMLLFLKSTEVLFYDVYQNKVTYSMRLNAMAGKAKALTDDELVVNLVNGELLLIKMEKDKIPYVSVLAESLGSENPNRTDANNNAPLTDLLVFKHDGSFIAKQINSGCTILYYYKREGSKISKKYQDFVLKHTESLFQVVSDRGLAAAFSQYPEANGRWTVHFYDQQNLFKEETCKIEGGNIFKDKAVVQFLR